MKVDTDGDGINDDDDYFPIHFDEKNGLIYQSPHKIGINYDNNYLADDLVTGDFTEQQLLDLSESFEYQIGDIKNNEFDFRYMSSAFFALTSESRKMINDLITSFMNGTDKGIGIEVNNYYFNVPVVKNQQLIDLVKNQDNTQQYFNFIKSTVVNEIVKTKGNINNARNQIAQIFYDYNNINKMHLSYPKGIDNFKNGLTISINDLWGSNVVIDNYNVSENKFSGTLHFSLYDHFGVDKPDMEKLYVNLAGFRAWFTLQHYDGYNNQFKPFINLMEYDIPFEGEF